MSSDESDCMSDNEQSVENSDDARDSVSSSVLSDDQQSDRDSHRDGSHNSDEDVSLPSDEDSDEDSIESIDEHNDGCTSKCSGDLRSVALNNRTEWLKSILAFVQETGANSLDLSNQNLKSCEVLSVFDSLIHSQITEINLAGNSLTNKMVALSKILAQTKLKKLNFSRCELTSKDLVQLIKTVKGLEITDLDISNNICFDRTKEFASHLIQSHITHLNIEWNKIVEHCGVALFESLPKTSVTYLNLSGIVQKQEYWCSILMKLFSNLQYTAITDLDVSMNDLKFADLKQLSEVLKDSKLKNLNLKSTGVNDAGVNVLTRGLIHSKLIDLNLSRNNINGHNNLGHYLKYTRITTLDLSYNLIKYDEMFNFPDFLKGSSVSTLSLKACWLGDEIGQKLMKSLKSTEVRKLNVNCNEIGPASTISEFCKNVKFTNITDVSFFANDLSPEMFSDLGDCLKESKLKHISATYVHFAESNIFADFVEKTKESSIVSLSLTGIKFKLDETVAKSLENTTFTHIKLDVCNFEPTDILSLGAALKFTAITHLSLSYNRLGDEGMETLAQCLKGTQVVSLDVSENSISTIGAKALADAVKDTNLLYLTLSGNKIGIDGLYYFAEQIRSTFVTVLDVDWCKSKEPRLAIDTALWQNRKTVQQLIDAFKRIAPETNSKDFQFDRSVDSFDFTFLEDCLVFYKTIIERPSSVSVLAVEKSFSLSKSQITTLMMDEFPGQFAMFIGRSVEADVTQHVNFLKRAKELGLNKLTELLLLNRPLYVIDEDEDILHPYVYNLMHQYKQPIVNSSIEPGGEEKIINYFTNHEELEGASDIINLLRQNVRNSTPRDPNA